MQQSPEGELALVLVFESKAISRLHENKLQRAPVLVFASKTINVEASNLLVLIVVCKPGGRANNVQDKISN